MKSYYDKFLIDFFWQVHGESKSKRKALGPSAYKRYKELQKANQFMVDYIERFVLKVIKNSQ